MDVAIRCLRNTLHTSRKLLHTKCNKCYGDIDTGTEYWSWAGLCMGSFMWYYKHDHCNGYGANY